MDGFRLVKLNEVIRQVDIVITCTGNVVPETGGRVAGDVHPGTGPVFSQRKRQKDGEDKHGY